MLISGHFCGLHCVFSFQIHIPNSTSAKISRSWSILSILGPLLFLPSSSAILLGGVTDLKNQEYSKSSLIMTLELNSAIWYRLGSCIYTCIYTQIYTDMGLPVCIQMCLLVHTKKHVCIQICLRIWIIFMHISLLAHNGMQVRLLLSGFVCFWS